jgi:alpha-glucuronidase
MYHEGVKTVQQMQAQWESLKNFIDKERFESVKSLLVKQERDAKIWRDACILYFQTFSKRPLPEGLEKPEHDLEWYIAHRYTDILGIP